MDKKDLFISNDDLSDIFGGAQIESVIKSEPARKPVVYAPTTEKKEEPIKSAPVKTSAAVPDLAKPAPEKSKLIMNRADEAFRAQELAAAAEAAKKTAAASALAAAAVIPSPKVPADKQVAMDKNSVDDFVKRAGEIEKESAKSSAVDLKFADFIDEKTVTEMAHVFNDLKAAFSKELAGRIDQKAIDNMMLRTLEKTALNFMLLKNTNWNSAGEIKQDGSIDEERMVNNMTVYKEQIQEIDKEIEESLKALMLMRLSAVKKGLGADKYTEIKNGLIKRSVVVEGGHRKAVAQFIIKNVMEAAMRKVEEEK